MLPKNRRINKQYFAEILPKSRSFGSKNFTLKVSPLKPDNKLILDNKSRFAFVVSGKMFKKAVDRNLIKRRFRAIIAKNLVEIKDGYFLIFISQKTVLSLKFKDLEQEVTFLLRKNKFLSNANI
ncbi:MAG: ribonuclease P protein component [Candidatus Vogelbacteria bacterium]|nr:ribonuclease P protein component [Candidatus Vogelbacteria bacterium]